MKKVCALLLSLLLVLGVAGCGFLPHPSVSPAIDEEEQEVEVATSIGVADILVNDDESVAGEIEELTTVENIEPLEQQDDLSDDELVELAVHFTQSDVNPHIWWARGRNIDVDMEAEPFDEEMFRPVGRFNSIAEMQEATEQIVSRRFAEEYLYTALNEWPVRMFLERDGRLYFNTRGEGGWSPFVATDEGHILSRSENEAIVAVAHYGPPLTPLVPYYGPRLTPGGDVRVYLNIRMVRESGGWRYDGRYEGVMIQPAE